MVQDKAAGTVNDFRISPVKSSVLSLGYYAANLISTLIVCVTAAVVCLVYMSFAGFYMSAADVVLMFLDILLLVLFGTALSSLINFFLSTQGQISAVGTIISAGYGFLCGAYMPISSFGEGLQKVLMFMPGTYGTSLIRNHAMRGVLSELSVQGIPSEVVGAIKDSLDCNIYFFGNEVKSFVMYVVLAGSTALLIAAYVILNMLKKRD